MSRRRVIAWGDGASDAGADWGSISHVMVILLAKQVEAGRLSAFWMHGCRPRTLCGSFCARSALHVSGHILIQNKNDVKSIGSSAPTASLSNSSPLHHTVHSYLSAYCCSFWGTT